LNILTDIFAEGLFLLIFEEIREEGWMITMPILYKII
jgi:hypothetical protein